MSAMFDLVVQYKDHARCDTRSMDAAIRRAAGKRDAGSGYCCLDGMRDLAFEFRDERRAQDAAERVRKAAPGARVSVLAVFEVDESQMSFALQRKAMERKKRLDIVKVTGEKAGFHVLSGQKAPKEKRSRKGGGKK